MSDPSCSIPAAPSSHSTVNSKPAKPKRVRKQRGSDKSRDISNPPSCNSNSQSNHTNQPTQSQLDSKRQKDESKKQQKQSELQKKKEKKSNEKATSIPKPRLKVIVRRLPPNLPEEIFWKSVEQWVRLDHSQNQVRDGKEKSKGETDGEGIDNDKVQMTQSQPAASDSGITSLPPTVDWKKFVKGKLSDNPSGTKPSVFSRAYIKFKDQTNLLQFSRSFDGHVFRDSKGNESVTVVEFAPYQRCPGDPSGGGGGGSGGRKVKKDNRSGTIEEDSDYQNFLASISAKEPSSQDPTEKSDSQLMSHLLTSTQSLTLEEQKGKNKSTPLLDYLRNQQLEKKALLIQSRSNNSRSNQGGSGSRSSGGGLSKREALEMANRQITSQLNKVNRDVKKRVGDSDVVVGKSYSGKASFGEDGKGRGKEGGGGNEVESSNSASKKKKERERNRGGTGKEKEKKEGEKGSVKGKEKEKEKEKDKGGKGKGKGKEKEKINQVPSASASISTSTPNVSQTKSQTQTPEIPTGPRKDKEKSSSKPSNNQKPKPKGQGQGQPKSASGGGGGGGRTEKPPSSVSQQAPIAILKRDSTSTTTNSSQASSSNNNASASVSIPTGPRNQGGRSGGGRGRGNGNGNGNGPGGNGGGK